jgi:hypothetical protein
MTCISSDVAANGQGGFGLSKVPVAWSSAGAEEAVSSV